jgi:hypothetical protein
LAGAAAAFALENLLPGAEVQPAAGDGHHHFPAHDLPLYMGGGSAPSLTFELSKQFKVLKTNTDGKAMPLQVTHRSYRNP